MTERFDPRRMTRTLRLECPYDEVRGPDHTLTVYIDSIRLDNNNRYVEDFEVGFAAGSNREVTVTCADDDTAPAPDETTFPQITATIALADGSSAAIGERTSYETAISISLSADPGREVWIPITITPHGAGDKDFDVNYDAGYNALRHTRRINKSQGHNSLASHGYYYIAFRPGGPLTQTFTVEALRDHHQDPGEYVVFTLGDPPPGITATGNVRIDITDQ